MGTYIDHLGDEKDTADMPTNYLENALNVALDNEDQDNIDVLQAELALRDDEDMGSSDENIGSANDAPDENFTI